MAATTINNSENNQLNINPGVKIVTDSVAQIPIEIAEKFNITVIPLIINIDGQSYRDGIDLELPELYRRMRTEKVMPTTSAPSLIQFQQTFQSLIDGGAHVILYISLSSKLSSAYEIACLAAEKVREKYPDRTIKVLDSRMAGIAEGFITYKAARCAAEGQPLDDVVKNASKAISCSGIVGTLETLEYLARGGRIGKAANLLGSMLDIKPILTIDENGTASPISKVRTLNRALQAMVDYVAKRVQGCHRLYIAILDAGAPKQADKLLDLAKQKLKPTEIFQTDFTPVMGVHTGPGLVGLGFYYE